MTWSRATVFAPFPEVEPTEFERATEVTLQSADCGARFAISGFTDSVRTELHGRRRIWITFQPVPDMAATHGMFDGRAHERSFQRWANTHRPLVAATFAGVIAAAATLGRRSR